jgi:predicted DNA binding CopG/RHH family protein
MDERDPSLSIRFTPEEIQAITDIANAKGMSRAGYIRKLVRQAIERETPRRKAQNGTERQ